MRGVGRRRLAVRAGLVALALIVSAALVVETGHDARSAVTTATLVPVADAFVESTTPRTNYGTNAQLIADASPVRQSFLRFNLSALTGPVQSARLQLHVSAASGSESPAGGTVALVNNTTWTESGITYNNRPTSWGATAATFGAVSRNAWAEVVVTSVVTAGQMLTLGVRSTNTDGAYYDSRQSGANAPQLIVTTGVPDSTTTPSSSSTTSSSTTTTTTPPGAATLAPVADAFVESTTPTVNYGTNAQLIADADPIRESFLRFDLSGLTGTVQSARLRLHVSAAAGSESPAGGTVALVNDTTWTESGITYDDRPTSWGATAATIGAVSVNAWADIVVTSAVTAGQVLTLGVRSTNTDGAYYDSRQSGANAPQLIVTTGTPTPPLEGFHLATVGDLACPPTMVVTATTCRQLEVSNLIGADPANEMFMPLGDLQYGGASLTDLQSGYGPSYGRFKTKTSPVIGNHEYDPGGPSGYFSYFGAAAGDPAKGYYSFDVGTSWHVIALNANCTIVACASGSAQEQWLRSDLAASSRTCIVAAWHQPRFSSGTSHGNDATVTPFWDALQQYNADLVLGGHVHNYERFAPQLSNGTASANGIREFVVGTGGRSLDSFGAPVANSEVRLPTFGILRLTLGANAYAWQFVNEAGTVLDSGTGTCH